MRTELRQGEQVIKEGASSLQKNIEIVGGKLRLTNQRLLFETHRFNVLRGVTDIELSSIQALGPCWTKLLGFLPLFPNSLAIFTLQGKEYRFVLFGRHAWAAAIKAQRET